MRIALDKTRESASSDDEPLMLLKSRTLIFSKQQQSYQEPLTVSLMLCWHIFKNKVAKERKQSRAPS
jgi:hypothetical protein